MPLVRPPHVKGEAECSFATKIPNVPNGWVPTEIYPVLANPYSRCAVRPSIHCLSSAVKNGINSFMISYSKKLAQTMRRGPKRSYNRRRKGQPSRYGICLVFDGLCNDART